MSKRKKEGRGRFTAIRKSEAVVRLLKGEDLDVISRELGVTAATLSEWSDAFRLSKQRACMLVQLGRASFYRQSKAKDQTPPRERIRELAEVGPRFRKHQARLPPVQARGIGRPHDEAKEAGSHLRVVPAAPTRPNERWSIDFVRDSLMDGRKFRVPTVVDVFTCECLPVHADSSLSGKKVAGILDTVATSRSHPKEITVDNGTEFFSKAMDAWAYQPSVKLDFIRPGRPMENGYVESSNGRLRDECLNVELFSDLVDARAKIFDFIEVFYNCRRRHSAIGNLSPVDYENACAVTRLVA